MNILFISNMFTTVAEWLLDNGHETKILARSRYDIYKHTQNSSAAVMVGTAKELYKKAISLIRSFKPDLIHISSSVELLVIARAFAWKTPIVFSYHGSDVRNNTGKPHKEVSHLADFIHVSTPDLARYGNWIDRPIDPMFHYRGGRVPNTAIMFYKNYFYADKRGLARKWCKTRGIKLTILDDSHSDYPIPNNQMPAVLSRFAYLLDFKGHTKELFALSKVALESLSCGCKVIHDSDLDHSISPSEHENIGVSSYINLYEYLETQQRTRFRLLYIIAKFLTGRLSKFEKYRYDNDVIQ